MKKVLLVFISVTLFYTAHAQYEFGVVGGPASAWFLNKNVSSAGKQQNYALSLSYNFGIHFAVDVTQTVGVVANMLIGKYNQKYTGTFTPTTIASGNTQTYKSDAALNTIDIPLIFRFQNKSNSFAEIGIQYSMISGANYSITYTNPNGSASRDVSPCFAKSNLQGIFGFGDNFMINDSWFIVTDFRFLYGFTDIKGVDGIGRNLNDPELYSGFTSGYPNYQPTHTLTGCFTIGVYYYLEAAFAHHQGHQKCKGTPKVRS